MYHDIPPNPPYQEWSLHIEGQGRARPPVEILFAGTVNLEKPDPYATPEEQLARLRFLNERAQKNAETLERAVFILSQSETGRCLLEGLTQARYRIVFDDRQTASRGAAGLCDPDNRLILLRAQDDAEYLALLLGHESVHALQSTRYDLLPSTRHKPEEGIKLSFAIEADAYAQQVQIALELAYGDAAAPPDQILFQEPLQQMRGRFPDLVRAGEKTLHRKDSLSNGSTVAAVFQAFYDNYNLRTYYEDAHIVWANTYAPNLTRILPWFTKTFGKTVDSSWLKDRLMHRDKPYLNHHAPSLSFDDARHAGVSAETGEALRRFYGEHLPGRAMPVLQTFGVHMKNAANFVLGHGISARLVIKEDESTPPPVLRPPPRKRFWFWGD